MTNLLTMKDNRRKVKASASHIYRLMERGAWPQPVKIGSSSRWVETEVDEAIAALAARRKPRPQPPMEKHDDDQH